MFHEAMGGEIAGNRCGRDENQRNGHLHPHRTDNYDEELPDVKYEAGACQAGDETSRKAGSRPLGFPVVRDRAYNSDVFRERLVGTLTSSISSKRFSASRTTSRLLVSSSSR